MLSRHLGLRGFTTLAFAGLDMDWVDSVGGPLPVEGAHHLAPQEPDVLLAGHGEEEEDALEGVEQDGDVPDGQGLGPVGQYEEHPGNSCYNTKL